MNLKEFLMPDLRKLLLWFALALVFSFALGEWLVSVMLEGSGSTLCLSTLCIQPDISLGMTFAIGFLSFFTLGLIEDLSTIIVVTPVTPIIFLAIHVAIYLIACLIVSKYSKLKK